MQVRAFALLRLAANLGVGIGPAVGGWLALFDYAYLFYVDAATCWIAAALLTLTLKRLSPAQRERADASAGGSPWSDGPFLCFLLLVVVMAMVFFQVMSTLPLYWRGAHGLRENGIGLLLALNALIIVLFEMVLSYWAEKRGRMFLFGLGGFLICLGFGLMPLGSGALYIALTVMVWSVGEMLALPLMNAVVADRAGTANRGRYMGMITMSFSVAFMLAPLAGTFVLERFGASALWYGIGLLGPPLWAGALALAKPLDRAGR